MEEAFQVTGIQTAGGIGVPVFIFAAVVQGDQVANRDGGVLSDTGVQSSGVQGERMGCAVSGLAVPLA